MSARSSANLKATNNGYITESWKRNSRMIDPEEWDRAPCCLTRVRRARAAEMANLQLVSTFGQHGGIPWKAAEQASGVPINRLSDLRSQYRVSRTRRSRSILATSLWLKSRRLFICMTAIAPTPPTMYFTTCVEDNLNSNSTHDQLKLCKM